MSKPSRFDLETAIATWRQFHAHRRVFLRDDLDELEQHLRDHTAHLLAQGLDEETAFRKALQALGDFDGGAEEYGKVYWGKLQRRRQLLPELIWRLAMLKNYLKIALRNFIRQKGYTAISLAGLVIGVACSVLVLVYVLHEFSFDRFHEKADRIYRVTFEETGEGTTAHRAIGPPALAPTLEREFPEVTKAVRVAERGPGTHLLRVQPDEPYKEVKVAYADADFFEMFDFTFIAGTPQTALAEPYTMVLTASAAERYFGSTDVVGRTLTLQLRTEPLEVVVSAVIEDVPANSHFTFEMLGPLATVQREFPGPTSDDTWRFYWAYTYVLVPEGFDPALLQAKLPDFADRNMAESTALRGSTFRFYLQPLTDIHLTSHLEGEWQANGSLGHLYAFLAVGLFVLLIACINFVNLTTARSAERAREVGVRKVVGAQRRQLTHQFMIETLVVVGLAVVLGYLLALAARPAFNSLLGTSLTAGHLLRPSMLAAAVAGMLGLGALAGGYPALYLASLRPIAVLKQATLSGRSREQVARRVLVVTQFVLSIGLLIGVAVVSQQVRYMKTADVGFNQEHVVVLPNYASMQEQIAPETVKEVLLGHSKIERVAAVRQTPADENLFMNSAIIPEGFQNDIPIMNHIVDADFVPTLGLEMAAGRNFDAHMRTDDGAFLINEAAARRFGWDDPVGKRLFSPVDGEPMGQVIGVIRDFHVLSLHEAIQPIVFERPSGPGAIDHYVVRLVPGDPGPVLAFLEAQWQRFAPDRAFDYAFLDDRFEALYRKDERMNRLVGVLSGLAILIACFGLFGLAAFTAQRRTKEIGIRKVLGASVSGIVALLSKDFLKLVAIAFLVAAPLAYVAMHRWLEDFAYRIEISWWIFLAAGLAALLIALLTVSYQSIKAALADPVKSLRCE